MYVVTALHFRLDVAGYRKRKQIPGTDYGESHPPGEGGSDSVTRRSLLMKDRGKSRTKVKVI